MRPRYISPLAVAVLVSVACARVPTSPPGGAAALAPAQHVVVAPLNLGIRLAPELEPALGPAWEETLRYLGSQDRQLRVIAREDSRRLWQQTLHELGDSADHASASAGFARRLREHTNYDLLVMPSLVLRTAEVYGHRASWDGVQRRLRLAKSRGPSDGEWLVEATHPAIQARFRGELAGISLHVVALTAGGEVAFEGLGGLDLLHELSFESGTVRHGWQPRAVSQLLANADSVREGVRVAFERPLSTSPHRH
jgi:hypothetical protein